MNYTVSVPHSTNGIDFKNVELCWDLFIVLRDLHISKDQAHINTLIIRAKLLNYNPINQWGAIKADYYKFNEHQKMWLW